jgi:virginiamycin B lyase
VDEYTVSVTDPEGATTAIKLPAIASAGGNGVMVGGLAIDPQGDAWVTQSWLALERIPGTQSNGVYHHTVIDRLSPKGDVTQFTVPGPSPDVQTLATGHDGAIWYTEEDNVPVVVNGATTYSGSSFIGRVTSDGVFTSYPADLTGQQMISASDGALWFMASGADRVGRITMAGAISYVTAPFSPNGITAGTGGDIWIAGDAKVGGGWQAEVSRLTRQGVATTLHLPQGMFATDIALAPDGNLWFIDDQMAYDAFGVLQPNGHAEEFLTHSTCNTCIPVNHGTLHGLTWAGGYLWSTEWSSNTSATLWRLTISS